MSALYIAPVNKEGFALAASTRADVLEVKCSGNGDTDMTPYLTPFLRLVHERAQSADVRSIEFDFHDLYFLNSSCIKCFIVWLEALKGDPSKAYQVRFITNTKLHWQRRSLAALRYFASEIVSIVA